jgi:imidazoleglycerol phosphate synthase glutamine amidotransferase subunit HisH
MSKFQQKVEAQTKQIIGEMLGDQLLVEEGKEQQRQATDQGHHDQGLLRDERGQERSRDRAHQNPK